MRRLLAGVLTLALLCPLAAGELKVAGDVVTVVRGFPVTVTAPPGAGLYFWDVPDAVKSKSVMGVLTVTAAPPGTHAVKVTAVTARVREDREVVFDTREHSVVLTVGQVPPPPGPQPGPTPPPPPPAPVDPLVKELKAAYAGEADAAKAEHMKAYAALYRQAGKDDMAAIKTVADLFSWLLQARRKLVPDGALPKVRPIFAAQLEAVVGKKAADELSFEQKQRAGALFSRLAEAIEEAIR